MNDREARVREGEKKEQESLTLMEQVGSLPFPICTVTFYSFKGGVGRTLALLNVATLLAKLGNRVVIADFDLEAPGLDTYTGFEPPAVGQPGVLEFISDYTHSESLSAPSCKDYLYCVFDKGLHRSRDKTFGPEPRENPYFGNISGNGALYVMRAGRQDAAYRENLARLDWDRLFAEQDGHLLFANLKNELFEDYGCTFLLLDSRTGLTDVAGVCTAFLPDAVILMFYPDEQNTRGIRTVANAVRHYAQAEAHRPIARMYCASRVPNIAETRAEASRLAEEIYREFDFGNSFFEGVEAAEEEKIRWSGDWDARADSWEWDKYVLASRMDSEQSFALRFWLFLSGYCGSPSCGFGGARVCLIAESPSVSRELSARHGHQHNDCKPYMSLVSFSASNNMFERYRLEAAAGAVLQLEPGEFRQDAEDHIQEDLRHKWLTAPYSSCASESSRRQVEYARRWHPDIEPLEVQ